MLLPPPLLARVSGLVYGLGSEPGPGLGLSSSAAPSSWLPASHPDTTAHTQIRNSNPVPQLEPFSDTPLATGYSPNHRQPSPSQTLFNLTSSLSSYPLQPHGPSFISPKQAKLFPVSGPLYHSLLIYA